MIIEKIILETTGKLEYEDKDGIRTYKKLSPKIEPISEETVGKFLCDELYQLIMDK